MSSEIWQSAICGSFAIQLAFTGAVIFLFLYELINLYLRMQRRKKIINYLKYKVLPFLNILNARLQEAQSQLNRNTNTQNDTLHKQKSADEEFEELMQKFKDFDYFDDLDDF